MIPLRVAFSSSLGRKLITALTGLALIGFVIMHLAGNLQLLAPTGDPFNAYADKLQSLGPLLWVARIGLYAFFVFHIVNGIMLKLNHRAARPIGYHSVKTKGGPSRSNPASRNMAISGIIITIFLIIHLKQFTLGPSLAEGYSTQVEGKEVRDLYRLVVETFQNPWVVGFYVLTMLMLAKHLSHGFWSAFQSLGAIHKRHYGAITCLGWLLAIALGVGFLVIPVVIYFKGAM